MMKRIEYSSDLGFQRALRKFCQETATAGDVSGTVSGILADVRQRGDTAVREYTEQFDKASIPAASLRVKSSELKAAAGTLSRAERSAVRESISLIRDFHRRTLPKNWKAKNAQGGRIGEHFYPIRRVGLYIPGGNVPLVSTVLMTAVLAKLVKNPGIAVCTPPSSDGSIAPAMLAALQMIGVDEVYKVGGVQAIAAMAYGTRTIEAVDKIFGPGNAYVMEAKRQVLGTVGIDLLPGPSEVMIIADSGANANHVAADLIAQAEHGSGKEIVYLASTSNALLGKLEQAMARQLPERRHAAKIAKVLQSRCLVIKCRTLDQCAEVADFIAPEHLELQVAAKSIEKLTRTITTAGAILQGYETPTALGDFTAGPSHTLPTGRAGRFSSGLQAVDFMRRSSIVRYDARSLKQAAPVVETFARREQLDGHGHSVAARLND